MLQRPVGVSRCDLHTLRGDVRLSRLHLQTSRDVARVFRGHPRVFRRGDRTVRCAALLIPCNCGAVDLPDGTASLAAHAYTVDFTRVLSKRGDEMLR